MRHGDDLDPLIEKTIHNEDGKRRSRNRLVLVR
jgi:hypothetical protein